jgi:hypothetical protein
MEQRAEEVLSQPPHLVANLTLYSTEEGGAKWAKMPGWGCLCCESKNSYVKGEDGVSRLFGHDGWPQLKESISPGEKRRLGFVFLLSGEESTKAFRRVGKFYLWDGRFIGEAVIVD